ncbi:MAG: AAA family ATPase [Candidatus Thalassarchaeaceae archaeon]|jgi:chromosome partitioning protein|nr:AAA family ATPase [Candidatus Thalassarchaeaceae archaeon]
MKEEDFLPDAVPAPLVVEFIEEEFEHADLDSISSAEPRTQVDLPIAEPTPSGRARVVTVMNQKGGVGKTTTVINVATHLALNGVRVLVVDCDQQGNCATGLGIDKSRVKHTTRTLFTEPELAPACRHATAVQGLHLVVGERSLVGLEQDLSTMLGRERCLHEGLESLLPHYDIVFLDTAPSLGLVTINALVASDAVLVPVQTEFFALEGVAMLASTIREVRRRLNPRLGFDGVMMTMHAPTLLNSQVKSQLVETFGDLIVEPPIRRNIKLAEAPSEGIPIHIHAPESNGGRDYSALAQNLALRWGLQMK